MSSDQQPLPEPSVIEQDEATIKRLKPSELDALATHTGESVAPVFAANNWLWTSCGDQPPKASQITARVREMMDDVEVNKMISTGRLAVARWTEDDEENVTVTLEVGHVWPDRDSCS